MLTLTRKADYALLAMSELARCWPERSSARELADATGVPWPMLTNVLHRLRKADLVNSTMGGKGGYSLARQPERISLAEMIEAIEGPFRLTLCCCEEDAEPDTNGSCELEANCRIKDPVRRVHEAFRHFLAQISLAHLAMEEVRAPIALNTRIEDRIGSV